MRFQARFTLNILSSLAQCNAILGIVYPSNHDIPILFFLNYTYITIEFLNTCVSLKYGIKTAMSTCNDFIIILEALIYCVLTDYVSGRTSAKGTLGAGQR